MKIVHIVSTADGAPWMVALAREQQRLGHDVAAILPSVGGGIAAALRRDGIAVHAAATDLVFGVPSPLRKVRELLRLVRLLRAIRPDAVHSHITGAVVTSRIASWIADVPVHFSGNVHPNSLEAEVLRALETGTAFCDTKTIASSTYTRELYARYGVPEEQLARIFYAVDQSGYDPARADGAGVRRELGIAEGVPVVGIVAYFYPPSRTRVGVPPHLIGRGSKGHEVLLHAVPRVLAEIPDARFVLVGRGMGAAGAEYEASLRALAERLGIAGSVLFAGERADVPNTLAAFDVSVHPSLSDNLGGTVESLLMERPMVVSDIGGFADTVVHEETGLVVPAGDAEALARAIVRLLRNPDLARRLARAGRQRMLARFTLAHTVRDTEALLAGTKPRATDRYRPRVTLARLLAAPFRLTPVALRTLLAARRAFRSARGRSE